MALHAVKMADAENTGLPSHHHPRFLTQHSSRGVVVLCKEKGKEFEFEKEFERDFVKGFAKEFENESVKESVRD